VEGGHGLRETSDVLCNGSMSAVQFLRRFRAMKVVPVPVRQDNYSYLLIDDDSKNAAAVDPFDLPKLEATAAHLGVHIVANITTHHHFDHSGGNKVSFHLPSFSNASP